MTTPHESDPGRHTQTDFFGIRGWQRTAVGATAFLLVLAGAVATVRYFTKPTIRSAADSAATSHDHAAAAAGSRPESQPVMLSPTDARRIGVTFAVASLDPVRHEVRAVGELVVDETRVRNIAPKLDGWVEQLYVDYTGREVRAGEPLLSIYSPGLVAAQEELLLAKRLAGRVSAGTADAVSGAADLIESARRRLRAWDVPDEEIRRLEDTGQVQRTVTLRAPASGVVIDKQVVAGQSIVSGQSLFRVADLSSVWLDAEVFEQDLSAVRLGMPVIAEMRALPGGERPGLVTYVAPMLNPATRTAGIRVQLSNAKRDLKPGMFATVRFSAPSQPGVISVPRSAVLSTGERSIVFVKRPDGMLEPRLVSLGVANDERMQVLRGIAVGDTVVSSATFLVDAESSLGSALGGMGDMPGMDLAKPTAKTAGTTPAPPRRDRSGRDTSRTGRASRDGSPE
jgi:Cu(I)/Ag(I) efflux system membrane fusion protein